MRIIWHGQRPDITLTVFIDDSAPVPPNKELVLHWAIKCRYEPVEYTGNVQGIKQEDIISGDVTVTTIVENIDSCFASLEQQRKDEMVQNGYQLN